MIDWGSGSDGETTANLRSNWPFCLFPSPKEKGGQKGKYIFQEVN